MQEVDGDENLIQKVDNFKNISKYSKKEKNMSDYEEKCKKAFLKELTKLSKELNLGEVSFDIVYDDFTPEKVFSIIVPKGTDMHKMSDLRKKVHTSMINFSLKNDMCDYFRKVFIILD